MRADVFVGTLTVGKLVSAMDMLDVVEALVIAGAVTEFEVCEVVYTMPVSTGVWAGTIIATTSEVDGDLNASGFASVKRASTFGLSVPSEEPVLSR